MIDQAAILHRRRQMAVRAEALSSVTALWALFDPDDIDNTWDAILPGLLAVVASGRTASASVAASFYADLRRAERAIGDPPPVTAPTFDRRKTAGTLTLLGKIGAKNLAARRRTVPVIVETTLSRVAGSVGKQVLDAGREMLTSSMRADPAALGWRRVTDGDPCDFCATIARKGVIGANVDFAAHDHCGCTQQPVFAAA